MNHLGLKEPGVGNHREVMRFRLKLRRTVAFNKDAEDLSRIDVRIFLDIGVRAESMVKIGQSYVERQCRWIRNQTREITEAVAPMRRIKRSRLLHLWTSSFQKL